MKSFSKKDPTIFTVAVIVAGALSGFPFTGIKWFNFGLFILILAVFYSGFFVGKKDGYGQGYLDANSKK